MLENLRDKLDIYYGEYYIINSVNIIMNKCISIEDTSSFAKPENKKPNLKKVISDYKYGKDRYMVSFGYFYKFLNGLDAKTHYNNYRYKNNWEKYINYDDETNFYISEFDIDYNKVKKLISEYLDIAEKRERINTYDLSSKLSYEGDDIILNIERARKLMKERIFVGLSER
jgi:hypothetical protein